MKEWTHYYEFLLVENRSKFDDVNNNKENFQSNKSFQIIVKELSWNEGDEKWEIS
jgi:hypothetical protein